MRDDRVSDVVDRVAEKKRDTSKIGNHCVTCWPPGEIELCFFLRF